MLLKTTNTQHREGAPTGWGVHRWWVSEVSLHLLFINLSLAVARHQNPLIVSRPHIIEWAWRGVYDPRFAGECWLGRYALTLFF